MWSSVRALLELKAAQVNAEEEARAPTNALLGRGRYEPISAVDVAYVSNTFEYTLHGACELAHRLTNWSGLAAGLRNLTLYESKPAACTVLEFGAPRPPPNGPPPPWSPPPLPPPSAPPATIAVQVRRPPLEVRPLVAALLSGQREESCVWS